ncbi:MAG: hypothetical protein IJ328_01350 [Muribaculaceae bacterium]|nr:hypothetical protein [Muribaculaceae bacterium]
MATPRRYLLLPNKRCAQLQPFKKGGCMNTDSIKFETMENNVVVYDHPELEKNIYTSLFASLFQDSYNRLEDRILEWKY